jgi:gamma-glutamylcyclotransferase (GGCT)/AIG2-like uncharacterized protein YtfP
MELGTDVFAFYGSLRRSMQNYAVFHAGLEYIHSVWLRGYKMYALPDYPCVVKAQADSKIMIEVMRARNADWAMKIHELEIEAGYSAELIRIGDTQAVLYVFQQPPNDRVVDSGDWVTFFRAMRKV